MKNLLNTIKVAELRTVAKLKGIDTKLKKAELIDALLSSVEIAHGGNFVTFNRKALNGEVINDTVIPQGALVAYPVKDSYTVAEVTIDKYLCASHMNTVKKAVKEDTLAELETEVFNVANYAEVMVIRTLGDYLLAKMLFGTHSNNVKVEGLETVNFIDYSVASNYVDGIFFTKAVVSELGRIDSTNALQGMEYATLLMFNGIIDNVTRIVHNPLFIEEVSIDVKNSTSKKVKKNQYKVLKVNVEELVLDFANRRYVLPETAGTYVDMSENRIFRKYGQTLINNKGLEYLGVPSFLVFEATASSSNVLSAKARKALENKIDLVMDCIIPMGFYNAHTGTHVNVCAQSASQARKGSYYFTDLSVDMVQSEFIYGYNFGDEFVMANKQARAGLAFTSATLTTLKPSVLVLEDPEETVYSKTVYPTGVDKANGIAKIADENGNILIANGETHKDFTPNDGAGLIEVKPAMQLAYDLGLVSKNDLKFFNVNYVSMAELTNVRNRAIAGEEVSNDERRLLRIFSSIPKAYQIRFGGDKGLLSVFPFSEYRTDLAMYDIIEGSNMRKYTLKDYSNVSFEVASYSHHASEEVQMNYQFIQNLNIDPSQLIELAERKLTQVDKDILVNPTSALKFLGLVERYSDTEEQTGLTTKFAKVLTANPNMLSDTYVQQSIKKLLVKYIYSMAFATIPVKGSYHYVISDPFHFLGEGKKNVNGITDLSMKAGENYLNNKVATVGCFRSPMIQKSEAQKVNLVQNDKLWFLNDIIVLNPYELTLPAAGGADTDGDKFAVVEEEYIVNAIVDCDYIPFDNGIKATPVKYQSEEEVKDQLKRYFRATSKSSQIGLITNYATNYRDLELHAGADYNNILLGLRFLQGWEIDRAKTGAVVEIPEVISSNEMVPHWKYFVGQFNKKVNNDVTDFLNETNSYFAINEVTGVSDYSMELHEENNIYHSASPIGKLFDYVCLRAKDLLAVDKKNDSLNNFSGAFATVVNSETVIFVEGAVRELENDYRKELVSILTSITDKDDSDKRMLSMEALSNKYSNLVKSLSDDHLALAVACYRASYSRKNNETSSRSFPWSVMFDEMLEVIQLLDNSVKLVRLPKVDDLQSVKVSNANMLFLNGVSYGVVAINPGSYTHTSICGENYLLARRTKAVQSYIYNAPTEKNYQVTLRGFAKIGLTALNVVDTLADGEFSIQLINNVPSIVKDGLVVSGVASDDSINVAGLYNKTLVMKSFIDPKFTPKRITNDIHWFDQENLIAIAKSLTITFKVTGDLEDKDVVKDSPVQEESTGYSESVSEYNEYNAEYVADYSVIEDSYNGLNPTVVEAVQDNFNNVWDLNSIDAPAQASKITLEPVNFNMEDGVKAVVTLFAGTVGYQYTVVKTGRELSIVTSLPSVKDVTKSWLKRYVAYNLISTLIG